MLKKAQGDEIGAKASFDRAQKLYAELSARDASNARRWLRGSQADPGGSSAGSEASVSQKNKIFNVRLPEAAEISLSRLLMLVTPERGCLTALSAAIRQCRVQRKSQSERTLGDNCVSRPGPVETNRAVVPPSQRTPLGL